MQITVCNINVDAMKVGTFELESTSVHRYRQDRCKEQIYTAFTSIGIFSKLAPLKSLYTQYKGNVNYFIYKKNFEKIGLWV